MANALNAGPEAAAPPVQQQPTPIGNALQGGAPAQVQQGQQGQPQQQPPPQVTHAQAVAALRHFSAIARELEVFMKDPDLGKSNIKSKIIDGTTKLVAQRIIKPAEAATQLGTLPSDPPLQRKWVQQHFQQSMLAMNAVLDHHAATNQGTGDMQIETARSQSNPDDHLHDMASLTTGYQGMKRA